jgi:hypothetical protein
VPHARHHLSARLFAAIFSCLTAAPALAVEGGTSSYLKGYKDFLSGVLPTDPGLYLRDDVIYYNGSVGASVIGGKVRIGISQWSLSNVFDPTYVTPLHILGATYAFGAIVPFSQLDVKVTVDTARFGLSSSDSTLNLDDFYLNPIILGWNARNFHAMALVSIMMPTGAYNKSDLANTGLNYWAVQPQLNLTYLNPSSGWDISAGTTYVISSEDKATNYQSGDIFHLDWTVGKQITPALKLGMAGYLMQQVTKDSGSGATLGADEASVWALGPALNYGFVLNKVPLTLTAKWTHEFAATDTFRGNTVTTAISLKL